VANVKINDLALIADPASTDVLPVVDVTADITNKISIADILKTAPEGTAAAPAIAFEGDSNTGIYHPGSEQIAFSTSGVGRVFIASDGKVGIGTSAPGYLLTAQGNTASINVKDTGNNSNSRVTRYIYSFDDGDGASINATRITGATAADVDLSFRTGGITNAQERLRIKSTGNVGIGQSSPAKLLDVNGDALINGLNVGRGAGNVSSNTAVGLNALNANTTGVNNTAVGTNALKSNTTGSNNTALGQSPLFNNTTGANNTALGRSSLSSNTEGTSNTAVGLNALFNNTTGDNNTALGQTSLFNNTEGNNSTAVGLSALFSNTTGSNNTAVGQNAGYYIEGSSNTILGAYKGTSADATLNNTVIISAGATERLRIDSSGKVGIGTTSPATLLHLRATGTPILRIQDDDGTGQYSDFYNSAGQSIYNAVNGAGVRGAHVFLQGGNETARIDSSGRLGIGTSSPQTLLEIAEVAAGSGFSATSFRSTRSNFGAEFTGYIDQGVSAGAIISTVETGTATERIRVTNQGNVGIGTTSPTEALNVVGNILATGRVRSKNGTVGDVGLGFTDDQNVGLYRPQSDTLGFVTGSSERARIDSSGRLLVGTSTVAPVNTPKICSATSAIESSLSLAQYRNSASISVDLDFVKSRSGTIGTAAAVSSSDTISQMRFYGAGNSSTYVEAARITTAVDGGTVSGTSLAGRLVFSTTADGASSPTERMRITNDGSTYLNTGGVTINPTSGTTDGFSYNNVDKQLVLSRNDGGSLILRRRSSDGTIQGFYRDTTPVGTISVTTTATAYNTSSDYRLKENVTPVTDGITRLQQLKPSRFNFIADPDTVVDGFIAHEAQAVVPECVTGTKDEVDDEGNFVYQGIDQSKMVPLVVAALQEALAEIETLKQRLDNAGL